MDIRDFKLVINHDTEMIENSDEFIKLLIQHCKPDKLKLSGLGIMRLDLQPFKQIMSKFTKLKLNENMLTELHNIPTNIIKLSISHNNIKNINFLANNVNLIHLNVSYNENIVITENMFNNFTQLIKLKLAGINLETIPPLLFGNLNNLKYIDLAGNNISNIDDVYFPPELEYLNFSYNKIKSFEKITTSLLKLTKLYIGNNK